MADPADAKFFQIIDPARAGRAGLSIVSFRPPVFGGIATRESNLEAFDDETLEVGLERMSQRGSTGVIAWPRHSAPTASGAASSPHRLWRRLCGTAATVEGRKMAADQTSDRGSAGSGKWKTKLRWGSALAWDFFDGSAHQKSATCYPLRSVQASRPLASVRLVSRNCRRARTGDRRQPVTAPRTKWSRRPPPPTGR
jgi:hypothetical protein